MMVVTINCKKQTGYRTTEYLRHKSVFTSCDKMVHFKMAFPPVEEDFNILPGLIDGCDLLRKEVKLVHGNPVYFIINLYLLIPKNLYAPPSISPPHHMLLEPAMPVRQKNPLQ